MRAALAGRWRCLFANDLDQTKAEVYSANWGNDVLKVDDVHDLEAMICPVALISHGRRFLVRTSHVPEMVSGSEMNVAA